MTSKHRWLAGLLPALLAVALVGGAEAKNSKGFPCQIDLGEMGESGEYEIDPNQVVIPLQVRTSYGSYKSQRVCQGKKKVKLSCDALIKDFPLGSKLTASGFTCLINTRPCGGTGEQPVEADTSTLKIVATRSSRCGKDSQSCGFASIDCRTAK